MFRTEKNDSPKALKISIIIKYQPVFFTRLFYIVFLKINKIPMKKISFIALMMPVLWFMACTASSHEQSDNAQPVYRDVPYVQDYSIKYYKEAEDQHLLTVFMDRNGVIQVLSDKGLLRKHDGQFLYPGTLVKDRIYRPLEDKKIAAFSLLDDQFVYLDDKAVFSNAWAGKLYILHDMPDAKIMAPGRDFQFLISNGKTLKFLVEDKVAWEEEAPEAVTAIRFDPQGNRYWVLGPSSLSIFDPAQKNIRKVMDGSQLTALAVAGGKLIVGTGKGYLEVDGSTGRQIGGLHDKLPWTEITAVEEIDGHLWFGSTKGAFMLRDDGKFNYYNGERWLPGNEVEHIAAGKDNSVLILTDAGLGRIVFDTMTLHDKAMYFEQQVRDRHIRLGFNASIRLFEKGNVDTGQLRDSDNDGLWTSMYLGGEVFRYVVTKSDEALQNVRESLDAMERLYTVNPVPGFPSRSFARSGYIARLSDPHRWQHSSDPEWDWKATTSSDEAIGHIFVFGVIAELMDDQPALKNKAIELIDTLMSHIVRNDMYLVDYDGKPTQWGRWHPDYVNGLPEMVGDRKINSSNIIAMLQTAYHFTGKEKYKDKAFELMNIYGYFKNLMRPMKDVGPAPKDADRHARMLSASWNHSDDEMYFLGYWGLYRYAFNDTLKAHFKDAIIDHWEAERPEKEGLWNIMTALTGTPDFDLDNAMWYLREHPMDLIDWVIVNSHRKDIEFIEPNFRMQTTREVLPPDERPVQRHNGNMFNIDRTHGNGMSEHSAGDIWLLPYWMGRYLGVISEPVEKP